MGNRKDPPFFNEDNVGPFCYRLPFYDTMELFIETLTGTCFELRVSPFEAIISVKAKIQRLEDNHLAEKARPEESGITEISLHQLMSLEASAAGIPICQQHLIWNNMELEDDYCLNYYNISEGCTLKLVLAMRGGPINTSRVPVEDPLKEMAEYMESSRDEVWEKTSCNKQVTLLVYQEGDQLNFFRVVDRGDGTLTPLSESLSSGSVYSLCADEDEEIEPSPSGQQIIENSITMNKMKLLKAKMETMNLSKKPKKAVKVKPRPPIAPRPSSSSTAAARRRLLRVLPHIGQSCLPSPGGACLPASASRAAASSAAPPPADRPVSSVTGDFLKEGGNWESYTLPRSSSGLKLPSQMPPTESETDKERADTVRQLGSSLPRRTKRFSGKLSANNEDDTGLFPAAEGCVTEEPLPPEAGSSASLTEGSAGEQSSGVGGTRRGNLESSLLNADRGSKAREQHLKHAAKVLNGESEASVLSHRELSPHKNRLLSPLRCSAPTSLHNSLAKPQRQSKCFESGSLQSSASQNVLRSLDVRNITDPSFSRTTRFRAVKVDSTGKRSDIISKVEARDITEMANRASKEPVGFVNNIGFLASLARSASRDSLQSARGAGRLRTSGIGLSTNLEHFQEESLRRSSPQSETTEFFLENVLITSHL
ncbi:AN1-type zinc finger protein 4 isoform X7 [Ovis aries]|uniref:AN1-type zinc finger protein 4 isoform X7 n=1 Tax=Ovis aries TaxID=9940 RepID=UPI00295276E3|nr:AN1-type zinc finger protein 4 isoform X7 [Ovis aries]